MPGNLRSHVGNDGDGLIDAIWMFDCVGDSLERTCIPAKENEYLTRRRSAGFQMLGIDVS